MEPSFKIIYSCKVPSCNSAAKRGQQNKSFFRFPKDPEIRKLWKQFCGIEDAVQKCDNFRICEDHFDPPHFVSSRRISNVAVPTHKIVSNCPVQHDHCYSSFNISTSTAELDSKNVSSDQAAHVIDYECIASEESSEVPLPITYENPEPGCSSWSSAFQSQPNSPSSVPMEEEELCDISGLSSGNVMTEEQIMDPLTLSEKNDFSFLSKNFKDKTCKGKDVLGKIGLKVDDLTPPKTTVYKIHNIVLSRISILKTKLSDDQNQLKKLRQLYDQSKFEIIDSELNTISKEFINCQLHNDNKKPCARRYTDEFNLFALTMYKRSPRLYRYLQVHFELPCPRVLTKLLNTFSFDTGFNNNLFSNLQTHVWEMNPLNCYVSLLIDEIKLKENLFYDKGKQVIIGYEDLGHLGRFLKNANHGLVLMVRGARKKLKQPIAYYFTSGTVSAVHLKQIIIVAVRKLESIGLHVLSTVCDQASVNISATNQLCMETVKDTPSMTHFIVDNRLVVNRIFDACNLLKNTRNAMIENAIEFEPGKFAKFEHIIQLFELDQKQPFKILYKLKSEHFNFKDSDNKMKVAVAAKQLSHQVAIGLGMYSLKDYEDPNTPNRLPSEARHTAEFVDLIDRLFDSLNGSTQFAQDGKPLRCAISNESPHIEFWQDLLPKLKNWKIISLETGDDVTSHFQFINGWRITIRSMIAIWRKLSNLGFDYLCPRNFNKDPLENLLCCIRQHSYTNLNCHEFIAALKTSILNNLNLPAYVESNCADDGDLLIDNLHSLLTSSTSGENCDNSCTVLTEKETTVDVIMLLENMEDTQSLTYIADYILNKMKISECPACKSDVFSPDNRDHHQFKSLKEHDSQKRLLYVSKSFMFLVEQTHQLLYSFLETHGHCKQLEDTFKAKFHTEIKQNCFNCEIHAADVVENFLSVTVPFLLYKFVNDINKGRKRRLRVSSPTIKHGKKMKKLLA